MSIKGEKTLSDNPNLGSVNGLRERPFSETIKVLMKEKFQKLAQQYKSELLDSVIPFWLEKSLDKEYGGYFTCLDRDGSVFDTDKFVWLQGREVWMFAYLTSHV